MAHAVDAFDVGAVFALVAHEDGAPRANNLQLVSVAVRVEVSAQLSRDEVHFFHLLWRLSDQLAGGEGVALQTIVSLDVFNIWVGDLTPEEVEILHLKVILNGDGRLRGRFVLSLKVWRLAVHLVYLFNHGDEETTGVLMVRHDAETLGHLSQNTRIVMPSKHSIADLGTLIHWNICKLGILLEIAQVASIWCGCLLLLINRLTVRLLLHV